MGRTTWRTAGRTALGAGILLVSSVVVALDVPGSPAAAAATACGADGTPGVVALADPNFYIDTSITPRLDSTYVGYTVRAGTSSETGLRIELAGFTGGFVGLAPGQQPSSVLPVIPAGTTATAYFLLAASGITVVPQTHAVRLYRGADLVCERTFTYTRVSDTIKALANKVTSVEASAPSTPAVIGDLVQVTVVGQTGTLGAGPSFDPGVLSYAPTALSGFPASAWRLERTEMLISPNGVAAATTFVDRLYLSGASGPDRQYIAKYWFRAVAPAATSAAVKPVQYIASGTQVKHTDLSGGASGGLPAVSTDANLTLTKSATPTTFSPVGGSTRGGRVTYEVHVENSGTTTGSVDSIVDTLPAGTTFVTGSATVNGRAFVPGLGGSTLTFYGPILVGAGASTVVRYQVDVPDVAGTYVNSAVAFLASAQIDGTRDVTQSAPATSTVIVRPATNPVDAVNDSTSTNANTAVTISVLGNDSATGATITAVTTPGNGTATISGSSIVYTPMTGFGGTDSFTYTISDGFTSDTATVTVRVPQARNDVYAKQASANNQPQTLTVDAANGLLANDFCSAAPCTVATTSLPASGTLTMQSTGAFTYLTPNSTTTVAFGYRLTDANGTTATATVTIYVSDFGPDRAVTLYNTAVVVPVTANDSCTGTCNPTVSTAPAHGTAVASGNNITYTPTSTFWGVDTFTYSKGGSGTTALVTVMVAPPTGTFTTTFGTAITKTLPAVGYAGGVTVVACTGCAYSVGTAPTKGSVSINPSTGVYTYTPADGTAGADTFTINVTEPGGLSVVATVNVTTGPDAVDDARTVFASTASTTRTISFDVTTNDSCPGTCTIAVVAGPASGTLTPVGSNGSFTYSNKDAIGPVTFTYRATSSLAVGVSDVATVTLTVEGAADDSTSTPSATPVNIAIRANDYCDTCTLGAIGTPTVGAAAGQLDGTITYTPPAGFAGVTTFTYAVAKGGVSTTATVTVVVRPDALDDRFAEVLGATDELSLLTNDMCSNCLITAVTTPTGGSATIGTSGLIVRYITPAAGAGPFTFSYTITDSTGATDTATVTIDVAIAPTILDDVATTPAGVSKPIDVDGNDSCPGGFTCTVDIATDAAHGSVSLSVAGTADLQYTPAAGFTGTDTFTYFDIASNGLAAVGTVRVYVTPTAGDDREVAGTGQTIVIAVAANDVCLGCTPVVLTDPIEGSIGLIDAAGITYTAPMAAGTYTFTYRMIETDTTPATHADATVTVVVSDAAPDAAATPHDTAVTLDVIANDACASITPPCGVIGVSTPDHGSAAVVDAGARDTSVAFTPTSGFTGLATFTYTAGNGTITATGTVTVLVGPAARTTTVEKNTSASGSLLADATCIGCTVSLVSFAGTGDVTIDEDGAWSYTPALDWLGTDQAITYRITDPSTGLTRDGTLTVTVRSTTPSVTLTKTAGAIVDTDEPANGSDAGDTVEYTYVLQNTGGSVLADVTVTDDQIAAADVHCDDGNGTDHVVESLALSGTATCTAIDVLDQTAIDAGALTNVATVTATAPAGRTASLTVTKTAGDIVDTDEPTNGPDEGDTVTYGYVVGNTGNVTLTGIAVTDDKIAAADIDCGDGTNTITALAPGDTAACTATYTITQSDVDAGSVTNTATADGDAPTGATAPTPATNDATVAIARSPGLTLTKQGGVVNTVVAPNTRTDVGDRVDYTYTATNTGNVTLTSVALTDDKIAAADIDCGDGTNRLATFGPGDTATCTASVTLDQATLDAGDVTNVATVEGNDPTNTLQTLSTDPVTVEWTRVAALTVVKTAADIVDADVPTNGAGDVGDTIDYTYSVTSTGNVTLTDVTVTDDKIAAADIDCGDGTNIIASLAPGATVDCTATYALTQNDVDLGGVTNVATVVGTAPSGATGGAEATATATVGVAGSTEFSLSKSGLADFTVVSPVDRADAGDTVTYSYGIANAGEVTLTDIALTDDKIAAADIDCGDGTNIIASLAPGATVDCTATYALTQNDIDLGSVANIATVDGTDPAGDPVPSLSTKPVRIDLDRSATLTVVKEAGDPTDTDVPTNGVSDVGDTIDYSYVVTNTGNVTLTDVTLTDDQIADENISCAGDANVVTTLAPGDTAECFATGVISQLDVDAGHLTNVATVAAVAPIGATAPADATDSATVALTASPDPRTVDAVDDTATAPIGSIVTVDVLHNDGGTGIQIDWVSRPSTGSITLEADGVVLTPPLMFLGDVTFRYGITDGTHTDTANVTLHVTQNLHPLVPELFLDANGNGRRDVGEAGIGGIPVELDLTARGHVSVADGGSAQRFSAESPVERSASWLRPFTEVATALATFECSTSADGVCTVESMPVGSYDATAQLDLAAYGMTVSADPDGDGDLSAAAESGSLDPAVSFGIHGSSTLQGTAFVQLGGGNGYDPGVDLLLASQPIELVWSGPDGAFGTADDVVVQVVTAADGTYVVHGLPGGSYLVQVPAGSLAAGYELPEPTAVSVAIGATSTADVPVPPTRTGVLPRSGTDIGRTLASASWLIGLGLFVMVVARRRLRDATPAPSAPSSL